MYKALPTTKMNAGVVWLPADAQSPKPIRIDSPALEVMTDLRKVQAATIGSGQRISLATQIMIARRVRLLLVAEPNGLIVGLISARDTMGEKPVKLLQERRDTRFEELLVSDLMVPRKAIDVLDFEVVKRAQVGAVIETLQASGRQHALVVERDAALDTEIVRGIFSATQIARQLGVPVPISDVASTFAEISEALAK